MALVKLLQIKQPKSHKGFVLPSVVTASIVMLIVLTVSVSATVTARVALKEQYYAQLGQAAADAGLEYAKSCLRTNSNQPLWTDAKPLKPNTDCSGNETVSCPTTSTDAACSVLLNGNIRTVFSIPLPVVNASGYALYVKYNGTTEILRSSTKEVWRSYEQRGSWQTDFDTFVPILSDGLVLNLDAGNPYSYPKFGTTWLDLSGNSRNATLFNGVTYSSTSGGIFTFDGLDDYISLPDGIEGSYSYNSTMEIWARQTTNKSVEYFKIGTGSIASTNESGLWYTSNTMNYYFYITAAGDRPFIKATYSANIADGTWKQIVGTFAGNSTSGTASIYINGQLIQSNSSITTTSSLGNPGFSSPSAYAHAGDIGAARLYNRALSAAEVLQNYNASKDRFGL